MIRGLLIKLVGNKKRENFSLSRVKKVLIDGGRVGDIVVKTPMFRALSDMDRNIKIDVMVASGCESMLRNHPNINKIMEMKPRNRVKIFRIFYGWMRALKLRQEKYDLYFDFTKNIRFSHLLTLRLMKIRYLVGCERDEKFGLKKTELTIFDKYINNTDNDIHAVDINMNMLQALGLNTENRKYELYLGDLEDKYISYFDSKKINIVFNFLGSTKKRSLKESDIYWLLENIKKIRKDIIVHVLTTPSIYDQTNVLIDKIKNTQINLLPKTKDVLEAASIIKWADVVLSVDTGIVHIASVYNKPIVGIYTEDKRTMSLFSPRSDIYRIIIGKKKEYLENFDKNEVIISLKEIIEKIK